MIKYLLKYKNPCTIKGLPQLLNYHMLDYSTNYSVTPVIRDMHQ